MMHRMRRWSASMVMGAVFVGGAVSAQELTFRYNFDNVDEIRAGLDVFEERNPGINVTLERIAFKDARDQFIRETATGAGPDVAHMAYVWIQRPGHGRSLYAHQRHDR